MKALPAELEAKIDEIKSWMFDGDQKEVVKRSGVKKQNVCAMLNKRQWPSKKVLDAAIQVMNENKARFEVRETMKIAS